MSFLWGHSFIEGIAETRNCQKHFVQAGELNFCSPDLGAEAWRCYIRILCFTKVWKNAVEVFPPRHVEWWCPHTHSLRHIFLSTFHICNIFFSTFASSASPSRCMYVFISAASSKVQQWQTDECSDLDWRQVWVFRFVNTSANACYQLFMFVLYFALPTLNERIEGHVHFCRLW